MDYNAYDTQEELKRAEEYLANLKLCNCFNKYFECTKNILGTIKNIYDNSKFIRENIKSSTKYGKYVVNLRNFCQHHKPEFKKSLESAMSLKALDKNQPMLIKSSGSICENLRFEDDIRIENDPAYPVIEIKSYRNLKDGQIGNCRLIANSFSFEFKHQKRVIHEDKKDASIDSVIEEVLMWISGHIDKI